MKEFVLAVIAAVFINFVIVFWVAASVVVCIILWEAVDYLKDRIKGLFKKKI